MSSDSVVSGSCGSNGAELEYNNNSENEIEQTLKFHPPVYLQRYDKVYSILDDSKWDNCFKKLVDFGCSEFGFFVYIKRLLTLNEILFVDIDEEILLEYKHRLYPLTAEFLIKRCSPLKVLAYAGSVSDPDYHLQNTDVVTAIELIEHLYPETLNTFPFNIFGCIAPKIAIVTTPNADFNQLFSLDPNRFRHYDHKFEWTRNQFEDWANNIITRYPDYNVNFYGIGDGPEGTEHLGHCSQMAVFVRKDILETRSGSGEYQDLFQEYYKQIDQIEYPFENDTRTKEQRIIDELHYRISTLGGISGEFYNDERNVSEIPLKKLLYGDMGSIDKMELADILIEHNYKLEKCLMKDTEQIETCIIHELEESSCSSDDFDCDNAAPQYILEEEEVSDWDESDDELADTFAKRLESVTNEDCKI